MESFGESVARRKGALRSGPDGQLAVFPFSDGGAGLQWGMGDIGDGVSGIEAMGCVGETICDGTGPREVFAVAGFYVLFEVREKLAAGRLRSLFPLRADCGDSFIGFGIAGGGRADEVAVVDQRDGRQFLRGG